MSAKLLGRYIVADPEICHGKPIFRGTDIPVAQVLGMVASGMAWETIVEQCHNRITQEAIAEAMSLAYKAFRDYAHEYLSEPTSTRVAFEEV